MIMFDIAEWTANVLILGMGVFFWVGALGLMVFIISDLVERVSVNDEG